MVPGSDTQFHALLVAADVLVWRLARHIERLSSRRGAASASVRRHYPVSALRHQPAHERPGLSEQQSTVGVDRKSVVSGKSVSVRVDLVGHRIIKKKNKQNNIK